MVPQKISQSRNVLATWWVVSTLTALLLLLSCGAYLLRPSIRARCLFSELETLQLGHSTYEDAQRLAKKIGARPTYNPCDRSACEWDVRMGNSNLPEWWRGSGETFVVAFDVKDSVVVRKNIGYGIGIETSTLYPSSVGLVEQEHWPHRNITEPVTAGWRSSELYPNYEFDVYMTPKASAETRRRYTSYNFNCFWKYRGCRDARELLPTADPFPSEPASGNSPR